MTSGDNYGDGERGSKTENCGEEKELADSFLANHERQVREGGWEGGRRGRVKKSRNSSESLMWLFSLVICSSGPEFWGQTRQ